MANAQRSNVLENVMRVTELGDYVIPTTLRVVCDLRVADLLTDGPRPVEELAEQTGSHAPSLLRALRGLAIKGIFTEVSTGVFGLTPMAELLRSDHVFSLVDALPLLPGDVRAFSAFDHSVRTGEPSFGHVHGGQGYWEYLTEHPEESARFDGTQASATRLELRACLLAYDWSRLGSLVDVGGGNGAFLSGLLARHKGLRGTLFDMPHVVSGAHAVFDKAGVSERATAEGGSFFENVPAGHDAYLMKRILYSWVDDKASQILRAVRAGMRQDSKLLVVEPVVRPGDEFSPGKVYDLLMLAMGGGHARTEEQVRELFAGCDLEVTRFVPTMMYPIVEARPC